MECLPVFSLLRATGARRRCQVLICCIGVWILRSPQDLTPPRFRRSIGARAGMSWPANPADMREANDASIRYAIIGG